MGFQPLTSVPLLVAAVASQLGGWGRKWQPAEPHMRPATGKQCAAVVWGGGSCHVQDPPPPLSD